MNGSIQAAPRSAAGTRPQGGPARRPTALLPEWSPALGLFAVSLAAILALAGLRVAGQTGPAVGLVQGKQQADAVVAFRQKRQSRR